MEHLARDPAWTSWVGGLIVRAIGAWQRRVARARGVGTPLTGAITFVQRFGVLVNLNVHYHLLVPDGVFAEAGDGLVFVLLMPTGADLLAILDRVIRQVARRLAKQAAGVNDTDDADLPPDLIGLGLDLRAFVCHGSSERKKAPAGTLSVPGLEELQ